MAQTTVFNVYLCGHHTVDMAADLDDREYFVCYNIGACNAAECQSTDPEWFKEQLQPAEESDMTCVEELKLQFKDLMGDAQALMTKFANLKHVDLVVVEYALKKQPDVSELLISRKDEYEEALRMYLDYSMFGCLKRTLRSERAVKKTLRAPEFEFRHMKMHEYVRDVRNKVYDLEDAVRMFEKASLQKQLEELHTPKVVCFQPERADYEGSFGKKEMQMLKQAGIEGLAVLDSPMCDASIAAGTDVMARMKAEVLLAGDVFDTPATTAGASQSSDNDDVYEAMLKALEAEHKATMASKRRRRSSSAQGGRAGKRLARGMKIDTVKARKASLASIGLRVPRLLRHGR